jgi:Big-like domain-containing protein
MKKVTPIKNKSVILTLVISLLTALAVALPSRTLAAVSVSLKVSPNSYAPKTTATEIAGKPTSVSQTVVLAAKYSTAPGNGTKVTISVSSQCLLADYDKGGFGSASTSATTTFSAANHTFEVYVWGAHDTKYEGSHSCTATVTTTSSNPAVNGLKASATIPIADNDPAPAPTPTPSTPTPTTTTTQNTTEPKAPSTPKPATITVDGEKVSTKSKDIEIEESKPLVLSGKTVANGTVKLYIFSEPKTATVNADKNGNWTYSIADLPPGDHHVESEVTDPATGKKSKRGTVLAFTVKAAEAAPTQEITSSDDQPAKKNSLVLPGTLAAVFLLGAGAGGFWWWKKKRSNTKHTPEDSNPMVHPVQTSETYNDEPAAPDKESSADDPAEDEEKTSDQKL